MIRAFIGLLCLIFSQLSAVAGGLPDPLLAPDIVQSDPVCNTSWLCNAPYQDTNGRSPCLISAGFKIIHMKAGQSNGETEGETKVVMAHESSVCNLNYLDGQLYQHADPVLGASRSSIQAGGVIPMGYMSDQVDDTLIANGVAAQVIQVPMNIGGSSVEQWADGGPISKVPCIAMKRLAAIGLTPSTPNTLFIFEWSQGQSNRSTSTTTYQALLSQVLARLDSCGFVGRKFLNYDTWSGTSAWAPVQVAISNLVNGTTVWLGANLDSISNSCRIDQTHLNSACGIPQGAALLITSLHASGLPF